MKRYLALALGVIAVAMFAFPSFASAQAGHFIGTPTCTDVGTQVECSGKIAGLGSTETFRVEVTASGTASVTCTNPAGNVAPGQSFEFTAAGNTGNQPTPASGQQDFTVRTTAPTAPRGSCPNPKWIATVTDVTFGPTATLTLFEGNTLSDTATVPIT
jgi:hypothetical protein